VRDVAQYNSTTGTTSVVDHLIFDSFGQLSGQVSGGSYYAGPTTLSTTPRFGYASMRLDFASGLSYDNARWYDPANGNWLSQDPLGFAAGDTNTSRYCGNSPTNATDPSGEDAADTGPTPSLRELADRLPHFNGVSDSDQALINAFEAGYGQCVSARLNYLTQKRKELFNGYDPGHTPTYPGYGDRWLQSLRWTRKTGRAVKV